MSPDDPEPVTPEERDAVLGAMLGDPVFVLALIVRRGLGEYLADGSLEHRIGGPTYADVETVAGGYRYRITVERLDGFLPDGLSPVNRAHADELARRHAAIEPNPGDP